MLHTTNSSAVDDIVHTAPIIRDGTPVFDEGDITTEEPVGDITSSDVTLSETEPTPGSAVTVTVTATPESGSAGVSFSHSFNQSVASTSDITTRGAGSSVDPIIEDTNTVGATVLLAADDVTAGEPVTIEYTITTAETDGKSVGITGSVTNGLTRDLPERSYTVTPDSPADTAVLTGDVRRIDGTQINNVDQLNIAIFQDGAEIPNSPVQPTRNGEYTAEVPVEAGGSDYRLEVLQIDNPRFSNFSREITVQPQTTERVPIRLQQDRNLLREYRLDVTVANADSTQVKSALIPDGGQRDCPSSCNCPPDWCSFRNTVCTCRWARGDSRIN
jgi:hypothetical protein